MRWEPLRGPTLLDEGGYEDLINARTRKTQQGLQRCNKELKMQQGVERCNKELKDATRS